MYKYFLFICFPFMLQAQDYVNIAKNYVHLQFKTARQNTIVLDFDLSSAYQPKNSEFKYVYFQQKYNDIKIYNSFSSVVLDANNEIVHFNNKFDLTFPTIEFENVFHPKNILEELKLHDYSIFKSYYTSESILKEIEFINKKDTLKFELEWLDNSHLELKKDKYYLAWQVQIKEDNNVWLYHFNALNGKLLKKEDLVVHCSTENSLPNSTENNFSNHPFITSLSYLVFDYPLKSPLDGERTLVQSPYNRILPPGTGPGLTNGWHEDDTNFYKTTRGNNVYAYEDHAGIDYPGYSPLSDSLSFNYPYNESSNTDAAITNAFYWSNLIHDILYAYGFDEPSGNFQVSNMQRGGLGGDAVLVEVQDSEKKNNASFYTPVDGNSPRMQLHLWDSWSNFNPDSDFDNSIITHEYAHGWANRLTGGPNTNSCLTNVEQGGEGWSDYLAMMITTNWEKYNADTISANYPQYFGNYVAGKHLRNFPYSWNLAYNSEVTYGKVGDLSFSAPHGIGSIWATVLWDMTWEIILYDKEIVYPIWNTQKMVGNIAALKLVHEGLRLQACNPSFIDARDAIFQADSLFFNSKYKHQIDRAFARRGLGKFASTLENANDRLVKEDFSLIYGPELLSVTEISVCSGQNFVYQIQFDREVEQISWEKEGYHISSSIIIDTLTNTTRRVQDIFYKIYNSSNHAFYHLLKVSVYPSVQSEEKEIMICENETPITYLEGIKLESISNENHTIHLTNSTQKFNRPFSNSNQFYNVITYSAPITGWYTLNLKSSDVDSYLYIYSEFYKEDVYKNLLYNNDDGDYNSDSEIEIFLYQFQTIDIVCTTFGSNEIGNQTLEISPQIEEISHEWFLGITDNVPVWKGDKFNPVINLGTNLSAGKYTYYYSAGGCKIPMHVIVSEPTLAGTVIGQEVLCPNEEGTYKLINAKGNLKSWLINNESIGANSDTLSYSSKDSFTIQGVVKNGGCSSKVTDKKSIQIALENYRDVLSEENNIHRKAQKNLTSNIKSKGNQSIDYKAGNSIDLIPGFEISGGTIFKAEIKTCK